MFLWLQLVQLWYEYVQLQSLGLRFVISLLIIGAHSWLKDYIRFSCYNQIKHVESIELLVIFHSALSISTLTSAIASFFNFPIISLFLVEQLWVHEQLKKKI